MKCSGTIIKEESKNPKKRDIKKEYNWSGV